MALVKQLVPDTIAHLLVRLGKEEERGGREKERRGRGGEGRERGGEGHFDICGSTVQHPINLVYIVHNSFVVALLG